MNTKRTEESILYALVALASVGIGMAARRFAIAEGASDVEVKAIFWGTVVLCGVLYLSQKLVIYNAISWLFNKYVPKPQIEEVVIEEKIDIEEKPAMEDVEEDAVEYVEPTVDIVAIRQDHINSAIKQKQEKLQIALDYTQRIFAPYISDRDLALLLNNIELYSEGITDEVESVHTHGLSNNDIYHFGWNIYNHFDVVDQMDTAIFLKNVFAHALKRIEKADTIRRKLRNEDAKLIKLRGNLSPDE
ncbi:MAG: hypothetical protein SNI45_07015 [Rikenellaceae bacterium]